jgi:hypothetical protein
MIARDPSVVDLDRRLVRRVHSTGAQPSFSCRAP